MSVPTATARKNTPWGYKAVIRYADGRTHIPVRKNFKLREDAVAYAEKWVAANYRETIEA